MARPVPSAWGPVCESALWCEPGEPMNAKLMSAFVYIACRLKTGVVLQMMACDATSSCAWKSAGKLSSCRKKSSGCPAAAVRIASTAGKDGTVVQLDTPAVALERSDCIASRCTCNFDCTPVRLD